MSNQAPDMPEHEAATVLRIVFDAGNRGEISVEDGRFVIKACGAWWLLQKLYDNLKDDERNRRPND